MTTDQTVSSLEITKLHAAYAAGTLRPETLLKMLYARMRREQTAGLWITQVDEATALARARELGGWDAARPLFGIPFVVKDNIDVEGLPTTAGCPAFSHLAESSAPTVQSLLDAGAICLGKVNLDQFATGLVGSRSPYGACHNVFDPAYLSGGSSSGSAVAVALHYASFSLGTDTAGSGRVPAALNNIVGLKPSVGLLSNHGVVPACATLDCVSVFACTVEDAALVRDIMARRAHTREPAPRHFRFGVPEPLEFYGKGEHRDLFERSVSRLQALGGTRVKLDFAPFVELGNLLYGPFVVERLLGVGAFIAQHHEQVLPVTRSIILGGERYSARDSFRAFQRLHELRTELLPLFDDVTYLLTPTVPRHFTLQEDQREPQLINDRLGLYTRFVNFLGCPVHAVPQELTPDGLPYGVSLLARPGNDRSLDALAGALHRRAHVGAGRPRAVRNEALAAL